MKTLGIEISNLFLNTPRVTQVVVCERRSKINEREHGGKKVVYQFFTRSLRARLCERLLRSTV